MVNTAGTSAVAGPPSRRELRLSRPLSLGQTLGPMQRGSRDPTMRITGSEVVRVSLTPDGPASLWMRCPPGSDRVQAEAWGPGADWIMESLAGLIGQDDDPAPLWPLIEQSGRPERPLLRDLFRRMPGLRIPRSRRVVEALVPTILEQRVAGAAARQSYRRLVWELGEPAPGPASTFGRLRVSPSPEVLACTPYWVFHRQGVEQKRARTVISMASRASRLEALSALPPDQARKQLTSLDGVGEWTAAEVALIAFGDPDAVSVGDY